MQEERVRELVRKQRAFFAGGRTFDLRLRKEALRRLREGIRKHEKEICEALYADLGKTEGESYLCEVGMALKEIGEQIRHLVREIRQADCVVVGGASGLSAAGGGDFYYEDNDSFRRYFGRFAEKYHFQGSFDGCAK